MADIWFDVDTAISECPVNIMPLIDDGDFKTRETSVAYNAAGMDLVWNFVTTAGAYTQTAVTPTTSGAYDWAHQGDGMYSIEIPASGGGSINNDTEGFGWFTGIATGVLPWRGPVIGFRASGLNDALIDSAYSTTRGLAGTALPNAAADAAGGLIISDAGGLDADAQLVTKINAILDDTDLIDDGTSGLAKIATDVAAILVDTADMQPKLGAPAGASISADIAAVKSDTAAILVDTGTTLDGKIDDILTDTGTTLPATLSSMAGATFDTSTDSLEAIRNRGDSAWTTATGFSTHSASDVWAVGTRTLTAIDEDSTTLDLDATIRGAVGMASADLDTQLAALPTAGENADAVWEEAIADHSGTSGSTAEALASAGSAGDPWATSLPGSYGSGTAGKIIGDNLNATVSSRATQTSVDTIDGIVDDILVDTAEIGAAGAGLTEAGGTGDHLSAVPWNATWDAEVQSEVTDALNAYDPPTKAELDSAVAGLATAADLATVDGKIDTIDSNVDAILDDTGTSGVVVASLAANSITAAAIAADAGNEIADAILNRDMSTGTDSGSSTVRTVRQALRLNRNKVEISGGTMTVYKEDDSTSSWTSSITTDEAAEPITASDPAGP